MLTHNVWVITISAHLEKKIDNKIINKYNKKVLFLLQTKEKETLKTGNSNTELFIN